MGSSNSNSGPSSSLPPPRRTRTRQLKLACCPDYHGTTQKQSRASWCVTNTVAQATKPLRRCRLNLSLRLSAWHTTRTRHDPRRGSRLRHAHRTQGARAGRGARGRTRRASYFGSSSSCRRRRGPWGVLELPEIQRHPENEARLPATRPIVICKVRRLGFLERAWWLFFVEMRPPPGPVGAGIFLVWGVSVRPSATSPTAMVR